MGLENILLSKEFQSQKDKIICSFSYIFNVLSMYMRGVREGYSVWKWKGGHGRKDGGERGDGRTSVALKLGMGWKCTRGNGMGKKIGKRINSDKFWVLFEKPIFKT